MGRFRYSDQSLTPLMLGTGWFRVALAETPEDFKSLSEGDGSSVAPGTLFWRLKASPPQGQLQWLAFHCAIYLTIANRLRPPANTASLDAIRSAMALEARQSLNPMAAEGFNVALTLYQNTLSKDLANHTSDAPPNFVPKQTCDELLRWMLEFYANPEKFPSLGTLQMTDRERLLFNTHVTVAVGVTFQSARNQGLAYQGVC
jgi:hypothetical protein